MNEDSWDRLLKIRTSGRDDTGSDRYKYPYEPTPYSVLERLGNSGEIGKKNTVLDAAAYQVPAQVDRCFFFNPFCLEILKQAMARILESWYENQRELRLYFYYPSQEYEVYLNGLDELQYEGAVNCMDLFPGNNMREKILIFSLL